VTLTVKLSRVKHVPISDTTPIQEVRISQSKLLNTHSVSALQHYNPHSIAQSIQDWKLCKSIMQYE